MAWTGKTVVCLLLILSACEPAAASAPKPAMVEVNDVVTPPVIDGVMDDECWQDAKAYSNFADSRTGELVTPQTVVKMCRNENYIYFAFHALHPNPAEIPAQEKKRNGNLSGDDYVTVHIDSNHQHRSSSSFDVNSLGTQREYIEGGSAEKVQWRGDWHAAAKLVEDGYVVEMAIPFSLLKYSKNQNVFGICFGRWLPGAGIWGNWPDMGGMWDRHKFADWLNANPPWSRPRPVALGYTTFSAGDKDSRTRAGLDIKYPFANDSLGLISIEPDFSNIQQQVETVDFSYVERYVPDSRPFFQEWNVYTPAILFYSRRVPEFDAGIRLVGRRGPAVLGLMNAQSFGDRSDSLLQCRYDIGRRSGVSGGLADHRTPGYHNLTTFYNGWWRFLTGQRLHDVGGGVYTTYSTGIPRGTDSTISYSTWSGNGSIGGDIRYGRIEPTFHTDLGLASDSDKRGLAGNINWRKSFRGRNLRYATAKIVSSRYEHFDDSPFVRGVWLSGSMEYVRGYGISSSMERSRREEFHDATQGIRLFWNKDSLHKNGGIGISWGTKAGGDFLSFGIDQMFRLRENCLFALRTEQMRIGDPSPYAGVSRLLVGTLNYDLTPEKSIGGRYVRRLGKNNLYVSYRQQVRRGTDAYIIYGDPNAEESTGKISIKLVQPLY